MQSPVRGPGLGSSAIRSASYRLAVALAAAVPCLPAQRGIELPIEPDWKRPAKDWLIDPSGFVAKAYVGNGGNEVVLANGLVRRAFRVQPTGATVAFDDLVNGVSLLRGVKPEAIVELDGVRIPVGGLLGQPNYAFLRKEWVGKMRVDPRAFRLLGYRVAKIEAPFAWKRARHHDRSAAWPPKGVGLHMRYRLTDAKQLVGSRQLVAQPSGFGRRVVFVEDFARLGEAWKVHRSKAHERSSFVNEGKVGEILTPANSACFVERALTPGVRVVEATIDTGSDRSASWGPGLALVFGKRVVKFHLRPGGDGYNDVPQFGAWDGRRELPHIGGRQKLDVSKPWTLRIVLDGERAHLDAKRVDSSWRRMQSLRLRGLGEPTALRVGKLDKEGGARDFGKPGELVRLRVLGCAAYGERDEASLRQERERYAALEKVEVVVRYELYDGLPCIAKWIEVKNGSDRTVRLNRFVSEILALVEPESRVETRPEVPFQKPNVWVETDYATGGSNENGQRWSVHWVTDPDYKTQVNYLRQMPCLLECRPSVGPQQDIAPGKTFRSFKSYVLAYDSWERGRNGLARCKMYRTIAPWTSENPLMMHVRHADWKSVKRGIDQCAAVGFEMVILTFGSGFNIESESPEYLAEMKRYADYAKSKGVEIGGYSLLSSRRIGGGNDVVSPPGERPTHGSCPALTSEWGQRYFEKLYAFFPKTGFSLLEHDGPYPGDFDVTPRPPLQKGYEDSQWAQFWISANFYRWCCAQGIYTNTPDWYFLNGSTKCAMGYREVNWSLPRAEQVIHTRQNIYDGTWTKTPTMGWMFVPLTQYHGGGAAATVEPLKDHLDHYRLLLQSNLGAGVQACYRGPRLFDAPQTEAMVKAQVAWFKRHRAILESDIAHSGSRRADGRDLDWILHANPQLEDRGMLLVYNPLQREIRKKIVVDLYYTGLVDGVEVIDASPDDPADQEGQVRRLELDRRSRLQLEVVVPSQGMRAFRLRSAK